MRAADPGRRGTIRLARLILLGAVILTWEMLPRLHMVDGDVLPPFSQVAATIVQLLQKPALLRDIGVTLLEILASFAFAVPLGMLLGLLVSENAYAAKVFDPLLYFLFSIPKSIFLPMFILTLGIGFWQKVSFGCFATTLLVLLSTQEAVRSVRPSHVLVARAYGARRSQIFFRVYLPSMLPIMLEGLRLAMIFLITTIILAEMYGANAGIGRELESWGESFMMGELLAGILLLSLFAIGINEMLRWVERRYGLWRT